MKSCHARKSSDGGVESRHAFDPEGRQAGNCARLNLPRAGVAPGPSETPQACIDGLREFIRDAGDDDLAFAAWCALGLSVIHEVEATHG